MEQTQHITTAQPPKLNAKQLALVAALEKATQAALAFKDVDDGGTCNFDSPALDYRAAGLTISKAKQAIEAAGLHSFDWNCYGSKMLVICGVGHGQGNRNTAMAEAAHKSLKEQGYPCGMYYQAD